MYCKKYYTYSCFIFMLQGFDEYMNVVLDEAEEINVKTGARKKIGEFVLLVFSFISCC